MNKKISIKNISSATISLLLPYIHFHRKLEPGRTLYVNEEQYFELSNDSGFASMVREHYLSVKDIEENEKVQTVNGEVYELAKINELLDTLNITELAKLIPIAAPAEKETIVKLAIEKGITNPAITALIKKYYGIDVIGAINMQHQANE